jgi:putative flippase GtrA
LKNILYLLFIRKTDNVLIQFMRYGLVGGIAFIADFGVLFLFTTFPFFQIHYLLAASISFLAGLTVNYILSIRWVFAVHTIKNRKLEFLLFGFIGFIGLGMNALFIWFFTDIFFANVVIISGKQIKILLSKIISTAFVFIWNFLARKITLFSQSEY